MRAIVTLEGEPQFRPYPFGLPLDHALNAVVTERMLMLSRAHNRFDGPIAFCHGVSPDGRILHRAGRYSEALVVFEEPSLAYRLGFALGVQLFVIRGEEVLFQLRAPSIGRDPLLWTASASGGLQPGEQPRVAVLADAAEEIGLREDCLSDLASRAICTNDDTGSALVIYTATLAQGAEVEPSPAKVAEFRWASAPAELGGQVSPDTSACWEAFERTRTRGERQA